MGFHTEMATAMIEQPFMLTEAAAALAHEAVFVSRNPQLLLRSADYFIIFRNGEYRTSDVHEIEFLLGVVRDEARGNRGMEVRKLPAPPTPEPQPVAEVARPRTARVPRRNARKRGS
jgi:hypothetical protein